MTTVRRLETVQRDTFDFVMYYIYGQSGPSLLIDSMTIKWKRKGGGEVSSLSLPPSFLHSMSTFLH